MVEVVRSEQRVEAPSCGRRALLAELGIANGPRRAPGERVGYGCRCPDCTRNQWNLERFKYWLRGRLLALGADEAEVGYRVDGVPVDVYWRIGERRFAIEVRSGPLDCTLALQHTQRLRDAGLAGVLWLCPPGFWVAHLPALGIRDFAPQACDYEIESGMFDTACSAVVAARQEPYELRDFLAGWVDGDIVWGYRDISTGGWATVSDWEHHTRTQAAIIARQRRELVDQRTALAVSRQTVRDKQKQIVKLHTRLERAEETQEERADELARAQRTIADQIRRADSLRAQLETVSQTVNHWQLITCCAMMLIVTFIAAAVVVR